MEINKFQSRFMLLVLLSFAFVMAPSFSSVAEDPLQIQNPELSFVVSDIRLQGLQRVSSGTVFNLIPLSVGDYLDSLAVRNLMRTLFSSGFFKDIQLARDGRVLIVTVVERPAIESIELDGNKAIESDALLEGLADQGLKEGEIFKQVSLERMGLELERQYVSQGR